VVHGLVRQGPGGKDTAKQFERWERQPLAIADHCHHQKGMSGMKLKTFTSTSCTGPGYSIFGGVVGEIFDMSVNKIQFSPKEKL